MANIIFYYIHQTTKYESFGYSRVDKNECFSVTCRLFKQYILLVLMNQMASALFKMVAALGRNMIVANTFGAFAMLVFFALGGVVLSKGMCSSHSYTFTSSF